MLKENAANFFLVRAKEIVCHLYGGLIITGELLEIGRFELIVLVKGKNVIVFKHAIMFVTILE